MTLLPFAGVAWILNKTGQSHQLVNAFAGFMNSPGQKRKAFAGYMPDAYDVIVATFAKSGTNWAMQIALQIAYYLLLTFGGMKRAPQAMIERIAAWMDVSLTPAQLARVVEKSSFAYMKAHEDNFVPPLSLFGRTKRLGTLMRNGKAGTSDELIDLKRQAAIDRFCMAELQRRGSDFPYSQIFDVAPAD